MKKHSLFKFMAIILLLVLVLTYFFASRTGTVTYLPLGDILTNYIQSYYYFFDTVVFVLLVGAFYGVLNRVDGYKKLIDNIVSKIKPHSKKILFAITVLFALISSLTGINFVLIIFVPFVMAIILSLGYDKLVAISSSVISILVGFIGGIFTTFRDPNAYSYSATTFEKFVGVDQYVNIIPKIALLVLGVALLIIFINKHIKDVENKKVKYDLGEKIKLTSDKELDNKKKTRSWPLIVVLSLLFVLLILGLFPWFNLFEIEVFNKFHTWIKEINIKEFYIFNSVISSIIPAFGSWAELGAYMMPMVVLVIAIIVIKLIYRIKFDDLINDMIDGAKKMLPAACLMMLAYSILVCTYNNGFFETIVTKVSGSGDINFIVASALTALGSLLHVDIYYTVAGVFTPILGVVSDDALLKVFALAFQSLYGLVNIVGPTSLLLIFALSYLDVPYTTWLKYIWRFILSLFIVIFAVLLIIALI